MSLRFGQRGTPSLKIVKGAVASGVNAAASLIISKPAAAPTVFNYLLLDTFSSGTIASPRTCDIGFLQIVNTGGAMSVTGGELVFSGTTASFDRVVGATSSGTEIDYGRVLGRSMRLRTRNRVTMPAGSARFGFAPSGTNTSSNIGVDYNATNTIRVKQGTGVLRTVILGTNEHRLVFIQGDTHSKIVAQNGSNTPILAWVYTATSASNFAKIIIQNAAAHDFAVDDLEVFDTNLFATDFSDAVIANITPINGSIVTSGASCIWHLSFTLPGSPTANLVAVELRYRVQDASNYWSLRIVRNAGNTAWDLLLVSVVAGSPTIRKTVGAVGTPTRLIAIAVGNDHESWTDASGTSTLRGTTVTNSALATATGTAAVWDASTTIGTLSAWETQNNFYASYF